MSAKLILFNKMNECATVTITCHSEEMKSTVENLVDDIAKNKDLKILSVDWSRDLSPDEIRQRGCERKFVVDSIAKLPKSVQDTIISASLSKGVAMMPAPLATLIRLYPWLPEASRASLERNFNVKLRELTEEVEERIGKENLKKQPKVVARGRTFAKENMNFLLDFSKKALERVVAKPQKRSARSKKAIKSGKHKVKAKL